MGKPITTTSGGICFAFPDVCFTPPITPASPTGIPVPYPNIGNLDEASEVTSTVNAGGNPIVHKDSKIESTTGDQAGSLGAVNSIPPKSIGGGVEFKSFSETVFVEEKNVVRMFDSTSQNDGNAVGIVLGGVATVLVGG